MSKKVYYKVVNQELKSILITGEVAVQYKEQEYVSALPELVALGCGLSVFDNVNSLDTFLWCNLPEQYRNFLKIYSCEIKGEMKLKANRIMLPLFPPETVESFKKELAETDYPWPEGTVMAKSVKLLNEMREI